MTITTCPHKCFRAASAAQIQALLLQCPSDDARRTEHLSDLLASLMAAPCAVYCDKLTVPGSAASTRN